LDSANKREREGQETRIRAIVRETRSRGETGTRDERERHELCDGDFFVYMSRFDGADKEVERW
jgi:hypothetical protein